jgi:hypothetical protein
MATGKISMDELSLELQEMLKTGTIGGKTIVTEKFIIHDVNGVFRELGLGEDFPLIELLKLLPNYINKVKNLDQYLENGVLAETKKDIALLNEEINRLKEQVAKLSGGVVPPSPGTGDYSTNSDDYKVETGYNNNIIISLKDGSPGSLTVPSDPFVTTARLGEGLNKIAKAIRYIRTNQELIDDLRNSNSNISKYVKV